MSPLFLVDRAGGMGQAPGMARKNNPGVNPMRAAGDGVLETPSHAGFMDIAKQNVEMWATDSVMTQDFNTGKARMNEEIAHRHGLTFLPAILRPVLRFYLFIAVIPAWIFASPTLLAQVPPFIITQPQSTNAVAGDSAGLSVVAGGTEPLFFQWQFDGTNLDGATDSTLDFSDISTNQNGIYDVVISNTYGVVTSQIAVVTAFNITIHWTGGGDGVSWNDPNNWNTGLLPTSADSILIGAGSETITNVPNNLVLSNMICQSPFALTGNLTVSGAVEITPTLSLSSGISITASGSNAWFLGAGAGSATAVNFTSGQGALMSFPGLTYMNNPNIGQIIYLEAGPGAVLDLSSVQQMWAINAASQIQVIPQAGAVVNLSGLTNVSSGDVSFFASYTKSIVNLDGLQTFSGWACAMNAQSGGEILATNLNSISGVSLYVDSSSTLALSNLMTIGNPNIGQIIYLEAGPGAGLDLSSVQQMWAINAASQIQVIPQAGAVVNLSGLTSVSSGDVHFFASYSKTMINLSGLLTFTGPGSLTQSGGGLIETNGGTVYQDVSLYLAPAILAQPQGATVFDSSSVAFSVLVDGSDPLSYQWLLNQTNILTGETNATLSYPCVSFADAGSYTVVVANIYGSITSAFATLTVIEGPDILAVNQSGNSLTFTWNAVSNQTYQIQTATNLTQTDWTTLGGAITATNSTSTISEPIGINAQQFYRVVVLQ
jgi:hypothetical protein